MNRLTLLALLVAALGALSSPAGWAAEPVAGKNYYSIQLLSGSPEALRKSWESLPDLPYARVERRGGQYVLRVGFWPARRDAEGLLAELRKQYRDAFLRLAEYQPEQILQSWRLLPQAGVAGRAPAATNIIALQEAAQPNVLSFNETPSRGTVAAETAGTLVPAPVSQAPAEPGPVAPQAAVRAVKKPRPLPAAPDEQKLWQMYEQGQYDAVLDEIARLRAAHPGWVADPHLVELARARRLEKHLEQALAAQDRDALAELVQAAGPVRDCSNVALAWALAQAYAQLDQPRQAVLILERLVPDCPSEQDRLATLYKAKAWLSAADWDALVAREATASRSEEGERAFKRLRYDDELEKLSAANRSNDENAVRGIFGRMADDIIFYRDSGAALIGAWNAYHAGALAEARRWFSRVLEWDPGRQDARQGLALVSLQQGDPDEALRHAQAMPENAEGRDQLLRDAWIAKAQAAYADRHPADALALLEEAGKHGALPRHARLTGAWSQLQLGRADAAAEEFVALYREQPDAEGAQGVLNSLLQARRRTELERLAANEPLAGLLQQHDAAEAYGEKRFLQARALGGEANAAAGAVAAPQLAALGVRRQKTGTAGLSKLDLRLAPVWEAAWPQGPAGELRFQLNRVDLDSGALAANSLIGNVPPAAAAYAFDPTTTYTGWQPRLVWRREADGVLQLEAGTTPLNGMVSARPIGRLFRQQDYPWGRAAWAAYREPVRESILSYTGLRDPYRGQKWGRVVRSGLKIDGFRQMGGPWQVSGSMVAEALAGEQVADNTRVKLDAGIGYNLKGEGLDYAVLGLGAGFDHYARNLGQFTLGHGGYFSPQRYLRAGPSFDFLTEENRQAIAKGRLSLDRVFKQENAAPFFPLNPDGRMYGESREAGWSHTIGIQAVVRMSDHVQIGLGFEKRAAPQFNDFSMVGFLRILFEPRKTVLSADLPALSTEIY